MGCSDEAAKGEIITIKDDTLASLLHLYIHLLFQFIDMAAL